MTTERITSQGIQRAGAAWTSDFFHNFVIRGSDVYVLPEAQENPSCDNLGLEFTQFEVDQASDQYPGRAELTVDTTNNFRRDAELTFNGANGDSYTRTDRADDQNPITVHPPKLEQAYQMEVSAEVTLEDGTVCPAISDSRTIEPIQQPATATSEPATATASSTPTSTSVPPSPTLVLPTETPVPTDNCETDITLLEYSPDGKNSKMKNIGDETCVAAVAVYDTKGAPGLGEGPQTRIDREHFELKPGEEVVATLDGYTPATQCTVQVDWAGFQDSEQLDAVFPETLTSANQGPQSEALINSITRGVNSPDCSLNDIPTSTSTASATPVPPTPTASSTATATTVPTIAPTPTETNTPAPPTRTSSPISPSATPTSRPAGGEPYPTPTTREGTPTEKVATATNGPIASSTAVRPTSTGVPVTPQKGGTAAIEKLRDLVPGKQSNGFDVDPLTGAVTTAVLLGTAGYVYSKRRRQSGRK